MKRNLFFISLAVFAFGEGLPAQGLIQRKPLKKPTIEIKVKSPVWIGRNLKTMRDIYTELKVEYDPKTGNYVYTWKNLHGELQTRIYEPPIKIDVIVKASVEFDQATGKYKYAYELVNLPTSQQSVHMLVIERKAEIENVTSPDSDWKGSSKPSANPNAFGGKRVWAWTDIKYQRHGIPAGHRQGGFSFESAGLPGIVDCYAQGYTELPKGREADPKEVYESRPPW